jgi:hypothetical protein
MDVFVKCLMVVAALAGFAGVANAAMEVNTDRLGGDYTNVTLPPAAARRCAKTCARPTLPARRGPTSNRACRRLIRAVGSRTRFRQR